MAESLHPIADGIVAAYDDILGPDRDAAVQLMYAENKAPRYDAVWLQGLPPVLQTPDITAASVRPPDQRRIELELRRAELLAPDPDRELEIVVTEGALRAALVLEKTLGEHELAFHIEERVAEGDLQVRVIPADKVLPKTVGRLAFVGLFWLGPSDDTEWQPTAVGYKNSEGVRFSEAPRVVTRYQAVQQAVTELALRPGDSLGLLYQLSREVHHPSMVTIPITPGTTSVHGRRIEPGPSV
jgi:hypothetical protein